MITKTCKDCGKTFHPKTDHASYCPRCVKKRVGDSARRRGLCYLGAEARWKRVQANYKMN